MAFKPKKKLTDKQRVLPLKERKKLEEKVRTKVIIGVPQERVTWVDDDGKVHSKLKNKVYKDENGNPIPVSKGLPDKLTPEVERDALISLDAVPIEEEKPVIKGDKLVYENRLQGQVWRPEDDTSRAKIATLLKMYYANFPCDDDVAELLNVRVDTLKNWLKIHPDLHDAKDEGMYGIRSMYLDALKRSACGETYFEEVASGGQVHTVQKVRAPDPRALELVLKQTFKGKFKGEETGNKTAVQINILPFEKNGGV